MTQTLINLVGTWGYLAILVTMAAESAGVPISSEIVVPLGGALASQGKLNFVLVVLVASLANLAGSLIAFPNVNENAHPSLLPGYLAKPDGSGPFPAVVILHGCGGFFSNYASVADDLRWEGYVALAVDSLGPRGIPDACADGLIAQAVDAFAALAYLSKQSFVDPSRIAVLGYSMGGGSALTDVEPDFIAKLFSGSFVAQSPITRGARTAPRSSPRRRLS